ncbi:oligogalacturonate lyase family protein [Allosphingosinicella deserti]|uniref:Oligogalacturonate lyase n=1 Tax=Allosphingosinicella deserti TaxID=2116704 RepID=A0A2P7QME9_9SPHN|nr:oligogalacturonate lyase family protein [Sphingomonas deserti]PSJ39130.1 oligogalacturonate lyase [Sphingomonas deserti]
MKAALLIAALLFSAPVAAAPAAATGPREWVDALTGHRIVRISDVPGTASLYFHQNSYTPQGDKMVVSVPSGIATVDLQSWRVTPLVKGERLQLLFTGRKTRTAYYATRTGDGGASTIWAADIDTGKTRRIADLKSGTIGSINADESLLLAQWAERDPPLQPAAAQVRDRDQTRMTFGQAEYAATGADGKPLTFAEAKEVRLNERLEAKIPMEIFTIDVKTGQRRVVTASTDWLNHIQFSPTDPNLIMYCHEGPWHKVDRIWTIRTDGSQKTKIHTRTMNMEIAGHEFFSPDGKTIWYDLQTPRGEKFWLAGYELSSGKRKWYHLERNEWSVHFNQSPDLKLFSGDGGDSEMVAHAPDGKYLYLFHPRDIPDVAGIHAPGSESLISPGLLEPEKLVDMRKHDYRLEPNMTFTPDRKWVVFRSNMEGANHVYAVELAKAAAQ